MGPAAFESSAEPESASETPEPSEPSGDHSVGAEPAYEPTGVPEVDALSTVLEDLDVLPIEDHAQVFAEAHQRLHQALLSADEE